MKLLKSSTLLAVLVLGLSSCGPAKPPEIVEAEKNLPAQLDYNFHVKPILSDRCFACHGPDEQSREAGLRLDLYETATAGLPESEGQYAIVPGNLRKSQVFHRLVTDDADLAMPPAESNLSLTPEEKAILFKWIEKGAEYKEHWAFIPPARIDPPAVSTEGWVRNEVDAFILAHLEEEGLRPNEDANKETLIRRLTFDLTGLPPTIKEIDDFLADDSPDAYERVVDRLLQNEAYGERMAAEWMDVARYADSHGYQDDGMRNMWPWRDWVINSFNDNQPFDDFLTWQLAGDLLPEASREHILATGFNRNHMQSQEGGIVPEEYRVAYVADRTQTVGTAFMGLTLQCAQCHDHKYDPISQKEYFQIFGFFNNINEIGVIPYSGEASPTVILPSKEAEAELAELEEKIAALEEKAAVDNPAYDKGFNLWLDGLNMSSRPEYEVQLPAREGDYPLDEIDDYEVRDRIDADRPAAIRGDRDFLPEVIPGKFGNALLLKGESWVDMGKDRFYYDRNEPFSLSIWFKTEADSVAGPVIGKSNSLFDGNRGYMCVLNEDGTLSASLNHVGPDNSIEIVSLDGVSSGSWHHLVMTYNGSSTADGLQLYLNGDLMRTRVVVDNLHKSILYTYNFYKEEKTNWGGGNLRLGMIGPNQTHTDGMAFDEVEIFASHLTPLEVQALYGVEQPIKKALDRISGGMTEHRGALRSYYVKYFEPSYSSSNKKLKELRGRVNEIMTEQQEVMVMRERSIPRPTFILDRGAYDAPTEEVKPAPPAVLPAFSEDTPRNRLGLAEWLTQPDHPLTARVTVNRYWQMIFGQGIVRTPDDFGSQGELPSHPELLDWMATYFVDSEWDVKAFLKMLVMSSTYRQSSVATPELLERDPGNLLLARAPSYRMTAEMIRDNALAASGLLVPTVGGPSVHPYQPEGLWKELATRNETEYKQDEGDALYRRSMYTVWKRSTPPPSMISFDASERNFCLVKRQKTSTPLQALVLMNDPQYVEAARILAERMIREGGDMVDLQVVHGFRLLTSRFPMEHEIDKLVALYEEEHAHYEEHPEDVEALLAVGQYPYDLSLEKADIAAATLVATTIMNFDEAYMKR